LSELMWLDKRDVTGLHELAQACPVDQSRLYRMMVNPDLPGLGFVGFNSSFITTLSAELGAKLAGSLARGHPTRHADARRDAGRDRSESRVETEETPRGGHVPTRRSLRRLSMPLL